MPAHQSKIRRFHRFLEREAFLQHCPYVLRQKFITISRQRDHGINALLYLLIGFHLLKGLSVFGDRPPKGIQPDNKSYPFKLPHQLRRTMQRVQQSLAASHDCMNSHSMAQLGQHAKHIMRYQVMDQGNKRTRPSINNNVTVSRLVCDLFHQIVKAARIYAATFFGGLQKIHFLNVECREATEGLIEWIPVKATNRQTSFTQILREEHSRV